jgi:DNA-binding NarL/FixJ family response regulator
MADADFMPTAQVAEGMLADLDRRLTAQQVDTALARGRQAVLVHTVNDYGLCMLDAEFAARIVGMLKARESSPGPALTERELDVLVRVERGLSDQQIATELVISVGTVKLHIHHILGKLGVRNRTQAVTRSRELDIL